MKKEEKNNGKKEGGGEKRRRGGLTQGETYDITLTVEIEGEREKKP